ncbi:hypothetical protein GDO81_022037 [Engystomops pustulosus]|uniref:Uncharacterized protein n=1 Tax=Engystomops pustulosus TaxID=76066 RepID=A0AAV6Z556_ENGPU|nr:hypothetical protein GDO81_022037 [Engystomops pustulosus]KAG8544705.1 hypothetical protein GDO81_022037 [Engystomops pustulosus]KAG8544706.1 hypothetical protein GDO81_022037 [Engystomops pustulosus]
MAVTENVSSCSLSAMWDWSHLSLSGTPPAVTLLDAATDLLVLERNFPGALEMCERGLQIISTEPGERRNNQVKASLVVIAIQALAEMERWREVLPWMLQYYQSPQEIPHNIMEMCLLPVNSKVKQPHVMLELSKVGCAVRLLVPPCSIEGGGVAPIEYFCSPWPLFKAGFALDPECSQNTARSGSDGCERENGDRRRRRRPR